MSFVHENGIGLAGYIIPWTPLVGSVATATAFLLSKALLGSPTHKNGIPLPPGPPATWFWENPLPERQIARGLTALIDRYGPVISLRRGNHVTVIVGRVDVATEIMEKEGATLADRPHSIATSDMFSGGLRLVLSPVGDGFRRLRRAAHIHFQPKAAQTYQEIQSEAAKDVVLDVLNDPKRHAEHAERYASAVILRITYGKTTPTSTDDPEVVRIRQVGKNFQIAMRPGAHLVDRIPWLRFVPGYGRQLKEFHRYELGLYRDQLNRVRNDMTANDLSFAKTLLEQADDHRLSYDEMSFLAGCLFGAGSDTTAAGISIMVMAAACHPDAQTRVQEELDEVIGRGRVPTFADSNTLPQLHAFILESMRWRPVVPIGLPHRTTKDIVWRGQYIPAGATVIGCHWAISRDPVAFPDPETFNPQRWLTEDGRVRTDMRFYTYGFGRRVCPGQHVANRSLYITLASLLWSFRILQRPEAPINLAQDLSDAVVFHPERFEVDFVPRMDVGRLRELMGH